MTSVNAAESGALVRSVPRLLGADVKAAARHWTPVEPSMPDRFAVGTSDAVSQQSSTIERLRLAAIAQRSPAPMPTMPSIGPVGTFERPKPTIATLDPIVPDAPAQLAAAPAPAAGPGPRPALAKPGESPAPKAVDAAKPSNFEDPEFPRQREADHRAAMDTALSGNPNPGWKLEGGYLVPDWP